MAGEARADIREIQLKRYELAKSIVPIFYIGAFALPIWAAQPIAADLAGKRTNLTLTVSITIAFTLALGAGVFALLKKTWEQRDELKRQRHRIATLEKELDDLKP